MNTPNDHHHRPQILALALGLGVSVALYGLAAHWDRTHRKMDFHEDAAIYAQTIAKELQGMVADVQSIAALYGASEAVSPGEFARFARLLLGRTPTIQALAWAPLVPESDRDTFETGVRAEGLTGFAIRDELAGEIRPAGRRPQYVPIQRVEPEDGHATAFGFDLWSEPLRRATLMQARESGHPAATPPIDLTLLAAPVHQPGLLIVVPQTREEAPSTPAQRRRYLRGFAIGVVRPSALVGGVVASLPPHPLDLVLRDPAVAGDAGLLHVQPAPTRGPGPTPNWTALMDDPEGYASGLTVADRTLELRAVPAPGAYPTAAWPRLLFVLGLLVTVLVTVLLRQHQRTVARLGEREEQFRLFMDHSPTVAWIKDEDGRWVFINKNYERIFGVRQEDWLGKTHFDVWPPDVANRFHESDQTVLAAGCPQEYEESVPSPDGGEGYWQTIKIPFRDGSGRRYVGGISLDVTARRRDEYHLRRYRQIVETASDMLLFLDRELHLKVVNPAYAAFHRSTPEDLHGRSVQDVESPEIYTRIVPHLEAALAGEARRFTQHGVDPSGQTRWIEVDLRPFREQGEVTGIVVGLHDLTEMREAQAALESERTHLEERVAARTGELQSLAERLQLARLEAEQAAQAKTEFLAHMSHEIRTPLNAVLGLMQVLERTPLAPDQRDMVAQVRTAGRSLLGIINDILDLSKIEAGQLHLETRPFVLAPLLSQLGTLLGPTAHGKGLALQIAAPPALDGSLVGDALRLEQVLVNLIGNAIKFTAQGGIRIGVEALHSTAANVRLRFTVSDTGIGMTPEVLDRVFDPFTQADGSITRRFGGTGLGLSICKRLVELMGGTIGADSRVGEGSTFWFELPFARTAAVATAAPAAPADTPAKARLAGLHLLVADDSAMNREVILRMLTLEGARATPAGDGQQALDILRAQPQGFAAVLMDIQMPVLDGLSATRAIRCELGLTGLPIIAVTAGVLREERERARAAGIDDFLPKPVELEQLVAVLTRQLGPDRLVAVSPPRTDETSGLEDTTDLPIIPGIEPARIAQLARGDAAGFRRLLQGFVAEVTDLPQRVQADLAAGAAAASHLHRLRGSAANLGALDLARTARQLEEAIGAHGQAAEDLWTQGDRINILADSVR